MSPAPLSKKTLLLRSLLIAAALTILKFSVGWFGQSLAILASATDSLMDFVVSLANYAFIEEAEKPADKNHPYGHGKIESLAGLLQSVFIGLIAIGIAAGAVMRFLHPKPINLAGAGIAVMVVAMLINWWHVRHLRRSMNRTGSQVMASEYLHYASDFFSHLGVVVAIAMFQLTGQPFWDPLVSILIAGYLVYSVGKILRNSVSELLDEQLPEPIPGDIAKIIRSHDKKIIDFHELRTRKVGETKFIEFHIELRGVQGFEEAHDLTEGLIARIKDVYPGAVITVHTDPEGGD